MWAVGRTKPGGYGEDRTLTMHWDGSAWNIVPSPNDSSNDNDLFGVAAIASDDVWAVGNAGSLKTLAIHWDGASWGVVPTPVFDPNATNQVLVGIVALSSNNISDCGSVYCASPRECPAYFDRKLGWLELEFCFEPERPKF